MLEWAGISFGEENTLRLQKSIKVCPLIEVIGCGLIVGAGDNLSSNLCLTHELTLVSLFLPVEIGHYEWR